MNLNKSSSSKLIISVCAKDVRYVLSVYEESDLIVTHKEGLYDLYKSLGLQVQLNSFINPFWLLKREIYLFGQGDRIDLIFLSLLFRNKIIYRDCYQTRIGNSRLLESDLLFPTIQKYTYKFFGFAYAGDDRYRYFWVDFKETDIKIDISHYQINLPSDSVIILDDIYISKEGKKVALLDYFDFDELSEYFKNVYYKKHYLFPSNRVFPAKGIELNNTIPFELFEGYKFVIGIASASLHGSDKSISFAKILNVENPYQVEYSPNNFEEFISIIENNR